MKEVSIKDTLSKKDKAKKTLLIINICVIIFITIITIISIFYFYDEIIHLSSKEGQDELINKIKDTGSLGVVILTLIQALQVVVAFIPGEFVEIISGAMFGPFYGLIICLIGLNIGTLLIFLLVRWLGKPFKDLTGNNKIYKKLEVLDDSRRGLVIVFFLFLIPGLPKDLLIYPIPLSKMKILDFMIVSSVARIPSIVSSTFIGASLLNRDYYIATVITVITVIISVVGLLFNKQISLMFEKIFNKNKV